MTQQPDLLNPKIHQGQAVAVCMDCRKKFHMGLKYYLSVVKRKGALRCRKCKNLMWKVNAELRKSGLDIPEKDFIDLHGCRLVPTRREGCRCKPSVDCSHYDDCLDVVTHKLWNGWKVVTV